MVEPAVSVVVPVYNAERYLPETIESILNQEFADFELILVDDGSVDGTASCARPYLSDRVRYFRQATNHGGPSAPRNTGISHARGRYVAFFDSDDLMLPGKLLESAEALDRNPDVGLLCTGFRSIDGSGRVLRDDYLAGYRTFRRNLQTVEAHCYRLKAAHAFRALLTSNFIGTSSVLIPADVLRQAGGFDESLTNGDDLDMWLRIAYQRDVLFLDRILHSYRITGDSISTRGARNALNRIKVLERQLSLSLDRDACREVNAWIRANYYQLADAERDRGCGRLARYYLRRSVGHGLSWVGMKRYLTSYLTSSQVAGRAQKPK